MSHLTPMGWFHLAFAAFGLVAGVIQFTRRKGDRIHRALGYAYVYGMIIANATALTMYRFTGSFNAFHAGAIVNLVCIIAGMIPVLRTPRARLEGAALSLDGELLYRACSGGVDGACGAPAAARQPQRGLDRCRRCGACRQRGRCDPDPSQPAGCLTPG